MSFPKPHVAPDSRRPGLSPCALGALLAVPFLLAASPAAADRERAPAAAASDPRPVAAPAPAPVAAPPRSAPAPVSSSPAPSPSRSVREPSTGGGGGGSARGPERPVRGGVGVPSRGERAPELGPVGGGGGGGRAPGVVVAPPRRPGHGSYPRPRTPRRYHAPYVGWGSSWWWGGPWDWWWWPGSRWSPYWGWGGVVIVEDYTPDPDQYGRVDTDVSPEATEVYLDGTYIGSADDFDGYPDFLYLEPGTYELEFRHPSYETLKKKVQIRAGQAIRYADDMTLLPGKSRMGSFDPERRGIPLGRVFGKPEEEPRDRTGRFEARVKRPSPAAEEPEELEALEDVDEDVREQTPAEAGPGSAKPAPAGEAALPAERGRLRFEVEPADAAVYLDDRYVGTGEELAGLARGVPVSPGRHTVTVLRPGFTTRTVEVQAKPGTAVDVVVELEK